MAKIRSVINGANNSDKTAAEVKEALALLMSLAESKGKAFEARIEQDLTTGRMGDFLTVPITKIIHKEVDYRAITQTDTSNILEAAKSSLGQFSNGKALDGIAELAEGAVTAILGAGQGNEGEVKKYLIVVESPSIVRYDLAFWGRNVSSSSIKTHMECVLACVAFKSIVDVTKVEFNDFLALYGRFLRNAYNNDVTKIKELIEQAKEVFDNNHRKAARHMSVGFVAAAAVGPALTRAASDDLWIIQNPHIHLPHEMTTRKATEGNF